MASDAPGVGSVLVEEPDCIFDVLLFKEFVSSLCALTIKLSFSTRAQDEDDLKLCRSLGSLMQKLGALGVWLGFVFVLSFFFVEPFLRFIVLNCRKFSDVTTLMLRARTRSTAP